MVEDLNKKGYSSADLLNQSVKTPSAESYETDQVLFLYNQLMNTPFTRIDIITDIEKSLYDELAANPTDTLALIAFLQSQTMLGNYSKAKAIAYKLWELGSSLGRMEEYLYINNLLNLGLLEMASVLIKPKFETLTASIDFYYPLLLKLSTMTGNVYLLERLISHPNAPEKDEDYMQIISRYKSYNYVDHFKNVQRIVIENIKDSLCTYDYDVTSGVMQEIEVILYLNGDNNSRQKIEEQLETKLQEYYTSANIEKLSSFSWRIKPISSHPFLGLD